MHVPIGEGYTMSPNDADLDGAEEVYRVAAEIAEEIGDQAALAAATRELGVVALSHGRAWFVEQAMAGQGMQYMARVAGGESLPDILKTLPIAPVMREAQQRFERALEMYERAGDRRGAMSSIIGLAYTSWAPDIHFGSGAGRHIEEIRRLASRMDTMTKESERALAEAQMLYGAHVFARAKGVPDLAISRGEEAYKQARVIGDRSLEFLSAGGTALGYVDVGDVEEAAQWLDRAAATATEAPTPFRARMLEEWRGMVRAAAGDATGMRTHLERAVKLATEQGLSAARCEALAMLALEAARFGAETNDDALLKLAEESATEAKSLAGILPGHTPWGAQCDAAVALVELARGHGEQAVQHAMGAVAALQSSLHEDTHFEIVVPVAKVVMAAGAEAEREPVQFFIRLFLAMVGQRTLDEDVRGKWFRGPTGRQLVELAGSLEGMTMQPVAGNGQARVDEGEAQLLRLLTEGLTNREIAERLGEDEVTIARRLGEMYARIGAPSRSEATAYAFRERVV